MSAVRRGQRRLIGSSLLPLGVVLFALIGGAVVARGGDVDARASTGDDLYTANCAGCHQPGGEGLPGTFPPLAGNPAAADPDYVADVITQGKSGPLEVLGVTYDSTMPAFSGFSDVELAALIEHVVGLATGVTPEPGGDDAGVPTTTVAVAPDEPRAGDPDRGHDLFVGSDRPESGVVGCASCHTAGDVGSLGGSSLGPDLTDVYGRLGGETGLSAWLANPASPTMQPIFAHRPLTDAEIADLVAFLADAPGRDPSDATDWLLIAGLLGLAVLLGVMAIVWQGMRRPYARTLSIKTATRGRTL